MSAEPSGRRILCAHAGEGDTRGAHWLEPGERCQPVGPGDLAHLQPGTTVTATITGVVVELMDRLYLHRTGSDELIPLRKLDDVRPVGPAPVSTPISRALRSRFDPRAPHIALRDVGLSRHDRANLCVCSLHMADPIHIGATPWRALTAEDRGRVEFRRDLLGIQRYRPESTEPAR